MTTAPQAPDTTSSPTNMSPFYISWPSCPSFDKELFLLSVPAIANRCVFTSQIQLEIAQFRRQIAQKSQSEIANRCVSKSQNLNCNVFVFQAAETSRGFPNFQASKIAATFWGVRFRIALFPCFRNRKILMAEFSGRQVSLAPGIARPLQRG